MELKIPNWSKTGPTYKLGPDLATGVGDHKNKHRVPYRHFQHRPRYKAWKLGLPTYRTDVDHGLLPRSLCVDELANLC